MTGNLKRPHAEVQTLDQLAALGREGIMEVAGFAATRAVLKGRNGDTSLSRIECWALILFATMFLPMHPEVHVPQRSEEPEEPATVAGTDL